MSTKKRTIEVGYLARVEGEGAMTVRIRDGAVEHVELRIFEPPRFFEALLRDRRMEEAPDITARICGICPVAYQMSAVHAVERACGVSIDGPIRELRRLLYCGEWIESHVLHIAMLHAPDFLGYHGVVDMAKDHPELVRKALALKKTGNEIVSTLGGREIHPINVKVGGFYRVPRRTELRELRARLQDAFAQAVDLARWTATLDFPDYERDYLYVSLQHPGEYPFNEGHIVSSAGLQIDVADWDAHFAEHHVAHSNALHARTLDGDNYFVGPMARFNLNFNRLPPSIRELAHELGVATGCNNPFRSIIVRAIEVVYAVYEAMRIIDDYQRPDASAVAVAPRAAVGYAATEAPRGILIHRYELTEDGLIADARIVPPTSQNQPTIEDDLRGVVTDNVALDDEALRLRCETTIRNYNPCISCATHFLHLDVDRGDA